MDGGRLVFVDCHSVRIIRYYKSNISNNLLITCGYSVCHSSLIKMLFFQV